MQLDHIILTAAGQTWARFVLVTGLLLIGAVAAADGLFEAIGARLARARFGPRGLLLSLLGLVAAVTAVLNLDTSVVFLTPVLVHAARRRALDERPFLYGSVFMANAAVVATSVSGTRMTPSRQYPQSEGWAPTPWAAWSHSTAESEPVNTRLGPRSSPSRSATGCVAGWAENSTAAGKLFTSTEAIAPMPTVAQTPDESSKRAGPCHSRRP
jgi:hypothetical protein